MTVVALPVPAPDAEAALLAGLAELPAVMSPRVLAQVLDVTPKSLERWRDANTGPAYLKLPGSALIRYARDDVAAWLLSARVEVRP